MRRHRWWRAEVPSLGTRSAPIQDGGRTSLSASDCRSCASCRLFAVELGDRALPLFEGGLDPGERSGRQVMRCPAHAGVADAFQHPGIRWQPHDLYFDRPLRAGAQLLDAVEYRVVARVIGQPPVAEGTYPVEHRRTVAADEHWWVWPLFRLGVGPDALERDVLTDVGRLVLGPDRLHRLDPLPQDRHPPAWVGTVVAHLLAVPAGADPELEAAAGQVVDARHLLRRDDRVTLDDQADAAAHAQLHRGSSGRRQRHEQVVDVPVLAPPLASWVWGLARAPAAAGPMRPGRCRRASGN